MGHVPSLLLHLFCIPICTALASVNITQLILQAGNHYTFAYLAQQTGADVTFEVHEAPPGITIFVPTDAAFNAMPSGALSKLSLAQKLDLLEYHALPSYYSLQSLSSLSTSSRQSTLASANGGPGSYTLKVKMMSSGSVLLNSGLLSSLVDGVIYSLDTVSVFSVSSVLYPVDIFGSPALPPLMSPSDAFGPSPTPSTDSFAPSPAPQTSPAAFFAASHAQMLMMTLLSALLLVEM